MNGSLGTYGPALTEIPATGRHTDKYARSIHHDIGSRVSGVKALVASGTGLPLASVAVTVRLVASPTASDTCEGG